ncbi:MAG: hypothetical protein ACFCD0_02245 [Gemmataceae bacterium]
MSQQDDPDPLASHHEELAPPWAAFPTYERFTIGWRMGSGESYLGDWWKFIKGFPKDYESRLSYLRRHPPAPLNWCSMVLNVLEPGSSHDLEESPGRISELLQLGLVKHDAAYHTWLGQQKETVWPWEFDLSPEEMARYRTREFWFFSRRWYAERTDSNLRRCSVPEQWRDVEPQLRTGLLGEVDATQGLLTLARMLCAGCVLPPWSFGLSPEDITDAFEMDMGYADAYQLWMMCAFDDDKMPRQMLAETGIPVEWKEWIEERTCFG